MAIEKELVSKAGNPRLRTTLVQLAWLWCAISQISLAAGSARITKNEAHKKSTIVALARKLFAVWNCINSEVVIQLHH